MEVSMVRAGLRKGGWWLGGILCACAFLPAQQQVQAAAELDESGQVVVDGRTAPYLIRHLPVSSFPGLPDQLQELLSRRGCLIPQTYEARQPENVVHASLERAGSSDWAVLCSARGTVSLLIFFSSTPDQVLVLAVFPETVRLQSHDPSGVLGFNWGIDPASPVQIHQAQSGLTHRPLLVDHDALADSVVDRKTVYRFYRKNVWVLLEMPE
jgi:hypothetical protein